MISYLGLVQAAHKVPLSHKGLKHGAIFKRKTEVVSSHAMQEGPVAQSCLISATIEVSVYLQAVASLPSRKEPPGSVE
jgi:hypothetical protein